MSWIPTDEILKDPAKYYGQNIILAPEYSLVTDNPNAIAESPHIRFGNYLVLGYIRINDVVHILLEAESIEAAKLLEIRFLIEAINFPDDTEARDKSLEIYMVKIKLPDGSFHSFSQTVRN